MRHHLTEGGVLVGANLTTAEIFYRLPDHPLILQSYIWQDFDVCPEFPELKKFLLFWQNVIEGKLHSVEVMSREVRGHADFLHADGAIVIH